MLTLLAALLVAAQSPGAQPNPNVGVVWGQVRSESNGRPLRFAVVEVVNAGRVELSAPTDSNGIYVLREVPAGRRLLRATHIDHAPLEVEVVVPRGGQVALDIGLQLRPVRLATVIARASGLPTVVSDTIAAPLPELSAAAVHALEATPGMAEFGLSEMARDIPGQGPVDPSDVLYVRGGTADLKLVLLDGAPVYAPFHIGGLIQALESDWLSSARLYLGGAPARYDGGLSYVMDLETRAGRSGRQRAQVSADMLGAGGLFEGPITADASYMLGGRAVHGVGAQPFFSQLFPYAYGDALGRLDVRLGEHGHLSATGFWNQESVLLDTAGTREDAARWGNTAGSMRLRTRIGGSNAVLTVSSGEFQTGLPLGGIRPLLTTAVSRRRRAAADFETTLGPLAVEYGLSGDQLRFDYAAAVRRPGRADSVLLRATAAGDVSGVYVDAGVNLLPGLRVRVGTRGDWFSLVDGLQFTPRASATVALGARASLTLAGGRYRQYVRADEQSIIFVGSAIPDTSLSPPLAVARASHVTVALAQDLGDGVGLGLEGFYKTFAGLPSRSSDEAEASGVDLWVRRSNGAFTGWFGYSLAWIWAENRQSFSPEEILAGRHLISAGAGGPLIGGIFDVRVSYGSGLPFTAIPEPEGTPPVFGLGFRPEMTASTSAMVPSTPEEPDAPYLRVDARVERTWSGHLNGMPFQLTPYVKVLNALSSRDAIFYHFDRTTESADLRALASLPVLPVVGVQWRF